MAEPNLNFGNIHEYTVSELAGAVKRVVEDGFGLVRVRGELGRVTRPASGHVYLDLKDDKAVLSSVIWKGTAERIRFAPEQGMEVVATGRMTTFPGQSRYQLVIDSLEPAGVGALMALFEERKKKLAAEGLFAPERKRPLPFLPEVIGVVTSPSGAVIRDILHRLRERFPRHVIVWPTLVQGKGAEARIAAAIEGFNALPEGGGVPRPDVLIVARGGGSLEDLWCFNEEIVARAAAASAIPLISAVGHETDTTLIDFVADRRAPTPSAAAEIAVPVRSELLAEVLNKERRLARGLTRASETRRTALISAARGLGRPEDVIGPWAQRFDRAAELLPMRMRALLDGARGRLLGSTGRFGRPMLAAGFAERQVKLARAADALRASTVRIIERKWRAFAGLRLSGAALARLSADGQRDKDRLWSRLTTTGGRALRPARARFEAAAKLLETLSYENILARGFALVRAEGGALIRRAGEAGAGEAVSIRFSDGERAAVIDGGPGPAKGPAGAKKRPAGRAVQKSLFD